MGAFAICTHPNYTGRGYAQRLVAVLTSDILDSGRVPFLHVSYQKCARNPCTTGWITCRADIPLSAVRRVSDAITAS